MPMNIGITGFVLIALLALLLFGPSKLPQLGKAIGTTIREFRTGTKELIEQEDTTKEKAEK
ncbi:twin-arginine translocase TatA/TatE family subunit [Paenibacillus glycinis]|uniref:Sec-independent protein translocase protein TatA n=1 Tax=Paenibacillus glycinis TaxID=2697035 RepID=A0ABW9XPZ7_9BACL|nr:twin-arginine translocase TatA/TatE family subunit [Paenibacillus glycinis]NBD24720.1 twin-arginine translocase TatA/TatE family subunit [Paenibacillus glycinis]